MNPTRMAVAAVVATGLANAAAAAELRILNWADYTAPALIAKFEAETGIRVRIDSYETYQEQIEILLRGDSGYDLAVPAEYSVGRLVAAGLAEKVEPHRLPGFQNIGENWRGQYYDPGNDYTVPWHWGTTSFVVDTARYAGDADSLAVLFDPARGAETIGVIDDGDDVVAMAMRYLGLPRCGADPQALAAVETLLTRRVGSMRLLDAGDPVGWLASAPVAASMAWNGDAMRARHQRPTLLYAYPREGVSIWTDVLLVPKGAPNKDAALAFMAFLLRPENAALQSNYTGYANTILGSDGHMSAKLLEAPEVVLPPGARIDFLQACDAATYEAYRELWARVKARNPDWQSGR